MSTGENTERRPGAIDVGVFFLVFSLFSRQLVVVAVAGREEEKKQKSNGNRNDRFEEGWQIGDGGCCRRDFPPRLTGRR